jgi:hypothetical protein
MSAEFFDFEFQPSTSYQSRDFGAQAARGRIRIMRGRTQDVADFFFHAAAVASGAALQAGLHSILNIADYELRHPDHLIP